MKTPPTEGLLEPCDLEFQNGPSIITRPAWEFLFPPSHFLLTNIPEGAFLVEAPAPGMFHRDGRKIVEPWTVWFDCRHRLGISGRMAGELLEADRLLRNLEHREALRLLPEGHLFFGPPAGFVEWDLPEIGLRRGDLLVSRARKSWALFPRGADPLSRGDMGYLRDAVLRNRGVVTSLTPFRPDQDIRALITDRRTWWPSRLGWKPRVARWRPLEGPGIQPIQASSDEAALFELISSVGGRMPMEA